MLVTYKYKIHNFDLTDDNLVNMHILFLLQVVFSYFVKKIKKKEKKKEKKRKKRVKVLKEKSKDLEKIKHPKEKDE